MVGKPLSHYDVLEKAGEGGMGVVYKARDRHLHRFVAIHDITQGGGLNFTVMERVAGKTLDELIPRKVITRCLRKELDRRSQHTATSPVRSRPGTLTGASTASEARVYENIPTTHRRQPCY